MAEFNSNGIYSSFFWSSPGCGFRWLDPDEFELLKPEIEKYSHYTYMAEDWDQETPIKTYSLAKEPTLFLRFAYLENEQSYLDFATTYGCLLNDHDKVHPDYSEETRRELESSDLWLLGEPIGLWQFESLILKINCELWFWLINKDLSKLNLVVKWITNDNKDFINCALGDEQRLMLYRNQNNLDENGFPNTKGFEDLQIYNLPVGFASTIPKGDLFAPVKYLLKERINDSLAYFKVFPTLELDYNAFPGLHGTLKPLNLISAIWCQFFEAIVKNKRFKRCTVCNEWEDVTKKRITWTKHPECAARERTARYRAKKK